MPDEARDLASSNNCKRCNNAVTTGHRCRRCGTLSHKSCLKTMKAKFYEDSTVDCCSNYAASIKTSNVANSEPTVITTDAEKCIEQIKISYLEEIIRQKDLVIKNQAMLIESLQAQITLIMHNMTVGTENTANNPSDLKSGSHAEVANGKSKSQKKKAIVVQQNTPQITSSDVSCALHMAHASKVCNDVVNLTNEIQSKTQKSQNNRRDSRKLLVGNADNDGENASFKSAKFVQMKHYHVTNCDPETTQEALTLHLKKIVPVVQVELLKSRNPVQYSSFKISVPTAEASKVLKPEVWPSGVVVNHFFRAHRQPNTNES